MAYTTCDFAAAVTIRLAETHSRRNLEVFCFSFLTAIASTIRDLCAS